MRRWLFRVFRLGIIAVTAWLAYQWLAPKGLAWVVLVGAGVVAAVWIGWSVFARMRVRKQRAREDRWADAILSQPHRPAAMRELRAEIEKAKTAERRVQLTLLLAELLEADEQPKAARGVLDAIVAKDLPPRTRAILRHARAVASLSEGNADAALKALDEDTFETGDTALDMRIQLLRAAIAIEKGEPRKALEMAENARGETDDEVRVEARVVRAIALDALGDRADALKIMRALGDDMLQLLAVLGLPRVKALASDARETD